MTRPLALLGATMLALPFVARAQDTTQAYPWRLSYFPYVTVSPNDGAMGMARAVWFQQSRWDDRVSAARQVAVEGGYSTSNSWLLSARGDFPEIADGWRLQVMAEARKEADYAGDVPATRQVASVEVTRRVKGPVLIALRGDATHVNTRTAVTDGSSGALSSTEFRGRLALVIDNRDREYDTRKGSLLQGGVYAGSEEPSWYALASGWLPLSTKTRITARVGARMASSRTTDGIRMMPAWENAFVVGGGPESNRALPVGSETNTKMLLVSAEIRHDLLTFPFAGVTLIGFVDGGRAYCDCDTLEDLSGVRSAPIGWTFGPGAGVAVRLLRSAVLTATVARTEHATRVYVSSGWSW